MHIKTRLVGPGRPFRFMRVLWLSLAHDTSFPLFVRRSSHFIKDFGTRMFASLVSLNTAARKTYYLDAQWYRPFLFTKSVRRYHFRSDLSRNISLPHLRFGSLDVNGSNFKPIVAYLLAWLFATFRRPTPLTSSLSG